jgi:hypothetical protein
MEQFDTGTYKQWKQSDVFSSQARSAKRRVSCSCQSRIARKLNRNVETQQNNKATYQLQLRNSSPTRPAGFVAGGRCRLGGGGGQARRDPGREHRPHHVDDGHGHRPRQRHILPTLRLFPWPACWEAIDDDRASTSFPCIDQQDNMVDQAKPWRRREVVFLRRRRWYGLLKQPPMIT